MRKTISLVVLTNSGSAAKQFRISRATLRGAAVLALVLVGTSGFLIHDYLRLKTGERYVDQREQELSGTLASQRDEIQIQRQQISDFSNEINTLKERHLIDFDPGMPLNAGFRPAHPNAQIRVDRMPAQHRPKAHRTRQAGYWVNSPPGSFSYQVCNFVGLVKIRRRRIIREGRPSVQHPVNPAETNHLKSQADRWDQYHGLADKHPIGAGELEKGRKSAGRFSEVI